MDDVAAFLNEIEMMDYIEMLRAEEVNGLDLITMTDEALAELGVKSPLHRLKIKVLFERKLLNITKAKYPVSCVVQFLQSKERFRDYASSFEENKIDGELLLRASPQVLEELGVTKKIVHKTQIKTGFQEYLETYR